MHYAFDPSSSLEIKASSSIHPIHTTTPVTGWLDVTLAGDGTVDLTQPVGGGVELELGGMRSGNGLIDREAERRLDVRRHPKVTGVLTALAPVDGNGATGGVAGTGELTFHGVTRSISGTLRVTAADDGALSVEGTTRIDVTDFKVQPPSMLVVKVHKDVTIELHALARPDA